MIASHPTVNCAPLHFRRIAARSLPCSCRHTRPISSLGTRRISGRASPTTHINGAQPAYRGYNSSVILGLWLSRTRWPNHHPEPLKGPRSAPRTTNTARKTRTYESRLARTTPSTEEDQGSQVLRATLQLLGTVPLNEGWPRTGRAAYAPSGDVA